MPALTSPLQPPTTNSAYDAYGFSTVSGLYGPGAWAAWIIAISTSWRSILKGRPKASYDIVTHLLYTNWAAIDLIRQLRSEEALIGPVAAPVVVSYWGLVNLYFQHLFVEYDDRPNDRNDVDGLVLMYGVARVLPMLRFLGDLLSIASTLKP